MRFLLHALTALLASTLVSTGAWADERILNYDIDVAIQADGGLDVTERITVRAEGSQIRRGVYRDFPTRYRDRYGNRVVVDLEVLDVQRNGEPEPWFTESMSNGVRINTGDDDFLEAPAEHTFTLRYRTTRQLGFFSDHDELYWNAIGTGWAFPIDAGGVAVRLPAPVAVDQMSAEGYTGYQGDKGTDYEADLVAPGQAQWRLTRPLQPQEGFTIVLSFPKGLVTAPTATQRAGWLLRENRGVLIALIGLVLLLFYCMREWRRVGRDPRTGVIIARYEPPTGHTPASLRYLQRMGYDMRCFSAEVLALAVAGCLRIVRDKRMLKDDWSLDRAASTGNAPLSDSQRSLLERLFSGSKQTLVLKNTSAATVSAARMAHTRALDKALQPRYFKRNGASFVKAAGIAVASVVLAFIIAGGAGVPAIIVVSVLMVAALFVFYRLVRAPTAEGRALMDEIEGLKLYLSVAERDDLARMPGPDAPPLLDAPRYEWLLPFAVALEVEDAWTEKFTAAVGAAAAAAATNNIGWYRGGGISDLGSLSRAVGSTLTSQISSSSQPPGSSSGSGGGGSSGGGGGGGGGGGR
ncbi:MAG: DUF2207 domain-containing protein [Steroidobacter sp.]